MRKNIKNIIIIIFIICMGAIVYEVDYSPEGTACRNAGGRYFLDGECAKFEMVKIPLQN